MANKKNSTRRLFFCHLRLCVVYVFDSDDDIWGHVFHIYGAHGFVFGQPACNLTCLVSWLRVQVFARVLDFCACPACVCSLDSSNMAQIGRWAQEEVKPLQSRCRGLACPACLWCRRRRQRKRKHCGEKWDASFAGQGNPAPCKSRLGLLCGRQFL